MVDSGSTDDALKILQTYSQVEVLFRDFATQCNFGITQITTSVLIVPSKNLIRSSRTPDFFTESLTE